MKILFVADIHIKLGQKNVPKAWQANRYALLANAINKVPSDLVILGGDTFDRVPTLEEISAFFTLLSSIKRKTLLYAGNHEAITKSYSFLSILKPHIVQIAPHVEVIDEVYHAKDFSIVPYERLQQVKSIAPEAPLLFTHVRGEIPPHVHPEIDLSYFDKWKLVAAGDLHSHSNSQRNIVYPGSPMTTTFHRSLSANGAITIDTDTLEYTFINFDLPQLLKMTVDSPDKIIETTYHHTVYELGGNMMQLAQVEAHELIAKKIVSKEVEPVITFNEDMGIMEELAIYLSSILKLSEEQIKEVQQVLNDYI